MNRLRPYAYQPFSKGDCIGQVFAQLEAKALLAMLFAKFEFKHAGREPDRQVYAITSPPRYGVPVTVALRNG